MPSVDPGSSPAKRSDWLDTDRFVIDARLLLGNQIKCTAEQFPEVRYAVLAFMEEIYNALGSEHRFYRHANAELLRLTEQHMVKGVTDAKPVDGE